ncbi:MAG: type II toxin-antitoxin system VapC family toxin [Rhizobiaceae bacterium]
MGGRALIIETSALVAILLEEPEAPQLLTAIETTDQCLTTVVNAFEATLSVGRALGNRELAGELVPAMLRKSGIAMIGIDPTLYDDLLDVYSRYGRGVGHPAQLNFGDCFSYAIAKREKMPLLFKGEDFSKTDIESAI